MKDTMTDKEMKDTMTDKEMIQKIMAMAKNIFDFVQKNRPEEVIRNGDEDTDALTLVLEACGNYTWTIMRSIDTLDGVNYKYYLLGDIFDKEALETFKVEFRLGYDGTVSPPVVKDQWNQLMQNVSLSTEQLKTIYSSLCFHFHTTAGCQCHYSEFLMNRGTVDPNKE